jgi:integrase/recombinase XerD
MRTFKAYLQSIGLSESSIDTNYNELSYYLNYCEDQGIEPEESTYGDILTYIKYLQNKGVKQRTVQVYINGLRHYFNWLIKSEIRTDNPTQNITIKGITRQYLHDIIKYQDLESLYKTFKIPDEKGAGHRQNWYRISVLSAKRNRAMLGLMIWQGITTAELNRLSASDLKLREGKIYIPGSRKSNERELKLESLQVLDLMEYTHRVRERLLELNNKKSEHLFVSAAGNNDLHNTIQKLIKKLNEMNSKITSAKQIRASVIIYWLKNYNLREVQYMAGHRYVSSTENYLINDMEDLTEDITKYHPIG